jgi:hypothetical protein
MDPIRAWTRQRERLHRARAFRILLPGLPPLVLFVLLLSGVLDPPSGVFDTLLWSITLLVYAVFWLFLIRDARRFVEEATEMDTQFRTMMGDPLPADSGSREEPPFGAFSAGPVIAVAGRRIDPRAADVPRFPLERVGDVKLRLRAYFETMRPSAIVCSAACGADLLALDIAGSMWLHRRVVLPYHRGRFRHTSVTDRPGSWGQLFDRILDALPKEDLVVLRGEPEGTGAYEAVNRALLEQAAALAARVPVGAGDAPQAGVVVLLVWDGESRGDDDLTDRFRRAAEERGLPIGTISTL